MTESPQVRSGSERIGLLAMMAVALYLLFTIFKPFLIGFAWALFLATAFHPVFLWFRKILRGREWWASISTTLLVGLLLVIPGFFVASALVDGTRQLLPKLEARIHGTVAARAEAPAVERTSGWTEKARGTVRTLAEKYDIDLNRAVLQGAQKLAALITREAGALLQNIAGALFTILVTLILMAVLFKESARLLDVFRLFLRIPEAHKDEAFARLKGTARAVFFGVMMTALVQAILSGIGWWIVGLYSPPLFGFLIFFCALLPVGGPALVWLPGAIYLFATGQTAMGIVLVLWGALVVGLVDNFLKPMFIGGKTGLPMVLVLFSIFGGIAAYGMTGIFLGPLVVTFFLFLLEIWKPEPQSESS